MQLYAPNGAFGGCCLFVFLPFSSSSSSSFSILSLYWEHKRKGATYSKRGKALTLFTLATKIGQKVETNKQTEDRTDEHTKSILSRSNFLARAYHSLISLILVLRSHVGERKRENIGSTAATTSRLRSPLKCALARAEPDWKSMRIKEQKLLFPRERPVQLALPHSATPVTCSEC